jgi:hypothetical protein
VILFCANLLSLADEEDDDQGADSDNERMPKIQKYGYNTKSTVLKNSFAHAFQSILSKKIDEDKQEQPILAKYKRPAKEVTEEQRKENELKAKRAAKERLRLMGRHIPTVDDEPHERELQIIATKGVV